MVVPQIIHGLIVFQQKFTGMDPLTVTLAETNSEFAPENGWLEEEISFWVWPIFRGYVGFREGSD